MMRLQTPRGSMEIGIIVCDLDRTLTDRRLRVVPAALEHLGRARRAGTKTVLATGRTLEEVRTRTGLLTHFDAFILEGGSLVGPPGRLRALGTASHDGAALRAWLGRRSVPFRSGRHAISIARRDAAVLAQFPGRRAWRLQYNRDRVDVTPRDVDKGRAFRSLRRNLWPRAPGRVLAFADATNDLPLFHAAHYRVAVANAEPEVRRRADEVTRHAGGRGVAGFLQTRLREASNP